MKGEERGRALFGISLTGRPKWQQFLICSSGFFFGYLVNGICEEYVYNRLRFSYDGEPMEDLRQALSRFYGIKRPHKGVPGLLELPGSNYIQIYQVLPVMIMGAFIPGLRRKYPFHEYVSAVLLVVGLILFTLADAQTSPNFSVVGVVMVSGALVMDSFLGNFQEAIFTMNPETTQMEMLFGSTVVGLPFLIPPMVLTEKLGRAWNSCNQVPSGPCS